MIDALKDLQGSHPASGDIRHSLEGYAASQGQGTHRPPLHVTVFNSPLGALVAGATDHAIAMLEFADSGLLRQLEEVRHIQRASILIGISPLLRQLRREVTEYFAGRRQRFGLPIDLRGTPFQRQIWNTLTKVPYGRVCSYTDVARRVRRPNAVRAVGQANRRNRIVILVPCHRVIGRDGGLGGYSAGLWRKQILLDIENQNR